MSPHRPNVILVGTGVVGRAIMQAHVDAGVSFRVADQDADSVRDAVARLNLNPQRWSVSGVESLGGELPSIAILSTHRPVASPTIVIESIAERLDVKREFFARAEQWFEDDAVFCSNTSTLRITDIGDSLRHPERLCGLHFFMPVKGRPAVEVVRTQATDASTITACERHALRIRKEPLVVRDSPGFIVNRLLSPYLNEAMLLLGRGVSAEQLERAAVAYGMPMSPLELVDWIGTRTMFDAGRAFWQAFPSRFDPSPMLAALVKSKRTGRAGGAGVYDYSDGTRSESVAPVVAGFCKDYQRNVTEFHDREVMLGLAIPMWIEAAFAYRERVAESLDQFDLAMRGGLGYVGQSTWLGFFDRLGSDQILAMIDQYGPTTKSLRPPTELTDALKASAPTTALKRFAE